MIAWAPVFHFYQDLNMVERGLAEQRAVALYAIADDLGRRARRQLLAA